MPMGSRSGRAAAVAVVLVLAVVVAGANVGTASADSPATELEAIQLAWGRPAEQARSGLAAAAQAETSRLRNEVFPAEDRAEFAGRPRLTLGRLLPEIFQGDPWRATWPQTPDDGTHLRVHFTNRHGAKLTGDLWGPPAGTCTAAARCPGILVVEGGWGASARMYWWAAQTLAEAGYVVLTFDVQGHGESETFGHDAGGRIACMPPVAVPGDPAILREIGQCGGIPSEQPATVALGAEDAYDWFVSAANPWGDRIDSALVGAAGHSWGAMAVGALQARRPVRAVVGWDWLSVCPVDIPVHGLACPAPASEWLPARVPALDIEGDYMYVPWPRPAGTSRDSRLEAFHRWVDAGVDAMTLVLRGGTHFDYSSVPLGLPALRDGQAVAARFTRLWFDKYLRGDTSASAALVAPTFRMRRWDPMGRETDVDAGLAGLLSNALDSAAYLDSTLIPVG